MISIVPSLRGFRIIPSLRSFRPSLRGFRIIPSLRSFRPSLRRFRIIPSLRSFRPSLRGCGSRPSFRLNIIEIQVINNVIHLRASDPLTKARPDHVNLQ